MTRRGHLVRRFLTSVRPRPLTDEDRAFVATTLRPEEWSCWERLGPADRAESVATGRAAAAGLGPNADPAYIAAALLHDVGKADTGFGVVRRVGATVMATMAGPGRARAWPGALGGYVNHDELGSARLRAAGARTEAVSWAAAHHRRELWPASGIPPEVCEILAVADGEPGQE